MEDRSVLVKELEGKEKEAAEEISNLTKKQKVSPCPSISLLPLVRRIAPSNSSSRKQFLEKQFSDSQAHLRDIFSGMDRQRAAAA